MNANKPEHKETIGSITASIWNNQSDDDKGAFYSVSIVRRYKIGDEWKDGTTFKAGDLLNVAKVAERAEAWIAYSKDFEKNNPTPTLTYEEATATPA